MSKSEKEASWNFFWDIYSHISDILIYKSAFHSYSKNLHLQKKKTKIPVFKHFCWWHTSFNTSFSYILFLSSFFSFSLSSSTYNYLLKSRIKLFMLKDLKERIRGHLLFLKNLTFQKSRFFILIEYSSCKEFL